MAKNKGKTRANLLTKTDGKFIHRYFGSRFPGKTPSLGFDYCENRKVHLNLKGKLPVLGDAVELTITQNTYLVKRLTSLYLP